MLYLLCSGRSLLGQGISVDQIFSDDEDEQPRRKQRLTSAQSPEPCEQE